MSVISEKFVTNYQDNWFYCKVLDIFILYKSVVHGKMRSLCFIDDIQNVSVIEIENQNSKSRVCVAARKFLLTFPNLSDFCFWIESLIWLYELLEISLSRGTEKAIIVEVWTIAVKQEFVQTPGYPSPNVACGEVRKRQNRKLNLLQSAIQNLGGGNCRQRH